MDTSASHLIITELMLPWPSFPCTESALLSSQTHVPDIASIAAQANRDVPSSRDDQTLILLTIGKVTLCLQSVLRQLYYAERMVLHNDVTQSRSLVSSSTAFSQPASPEELVVSESSASGVF